MTLTGVHDLQAHLVDSRLSGLVGTQPHNTLRNCGRLVAGDPDYTFGLSDWRGATLLEVVDAVRELCGGDPGGADPAGDGWIDPAATLAAIEQHRRVLAGLVQAGGGRVLLATGHPTGLLGHYAALGRALQASGCQLLAPLDDSWVGQDSDGRRRGVRYIEGVACVFDGASLRHSHSSEFMEAILDELDGAPGVVDLVLADHGFAGAAVERGLPTLSIADVNDPALALAQARGRTDGVLPIDDNLAPRAFLPVTATMLTW